MTVQKYSQVVLHWLLASLWILGVGWEWEAFGLKQQASENVRKLHAAILALGEKNVIQTNSYKTWHTFSQCLNHFPPKPSVTSYTSQLWVRVIPLSLKVDAMRGQKISKYKIISSLFKMLKRKNGWPHKDICVIWVYVRTIGDFVKAIWSNTASK